MNSREDFEAGAEEMRELILQQRVHFPRRSAERRSGVLAVDAFKESIRAIPLEYLYEEDSNENDRH